MIDADFLDQISHYVATNITGLSDSGDDCNVFAGLYPANPDNVIAFLGNLGTKPSIDIPEFEYPRFQIVLRNADYIAGAGLMRKIRTLLQDQLAISLTNFYVLRIQAESDVLSLGQDTDSGLYEFSINFSAQIRYGDSIV